MERPQNGRERRKPDDELATEAEEAREGDEHLNAYDKADADSFPASDPPVQP
jgi:hypothetical protein